MAAGSFNPNEWLRAAARALVFVGAVYILEHLFQGALLPFVREDALLFMAGFTAATLAAALLVAALLLRVLDHRPFTAVGLAPSRQVHRELGIGLLAGVAPQLLIILLLFAVGAARYTGQAGSMAGWGGNVLRALAVLTVAAAAEEAVYRGYGFQALVRGLGLWPTLLVTSALFALAHGGNPSVTPFALINIFLAGIVLGLAYMKTLSLWLVTALHVGWNWSMASLLDLPVSGLTVFDTPLYEPAVGGPEWLTGGAFGPEGGLLGSAGLLLALVIAWRWPGLGPSAAQLAARPLPLRPTPEENQRL